MAYLSGYKRPRPDEHDLAAYAEYGQYNPASDFGPLGVGPPSMLHSVQPLPPLQPLQVQAAPADTIRLGSAPDGSMPIVKLRGLPFSCDVESINMFLEVETVDVVLVKRQGRFSGEAIVVLPGMMQVEFALNKHKQYMGKRYIEVQQGSREDYYKAVASLVEDWPAGSAPPPPQGNDLRGHVDYMDHRPPYNQYGAGPPPGRGGVGVDRHPGGGGRLPVRDRRQDGRDRPPPGSLPATGVLRLRGLPFSVSNEEIAAWFNSAGVLLQPLTAEDVHSVLAYDGRPNGTAFVHFSSAADAENAMAKDKAMMRARYVELFHSCEDEMQMAVGR